MRGGRGGVAPHSRGQLRHLLVGGSSRALVVGSRVGNVKGGSQKTLERQLVDRRPGMKPRLEVSRLERGQTLEAGPGG